jgi:hypothetical protein
MVVAKGAKGRPVGDPEAPMIDKFEKQRKEESRLVKGIFQDNEIKGGTVRFCFKKFKGDPVKEYVLTDGQEYEIPLSVAKHLNSGCAYEQHSYLLGPDGKHIKNPKKVHRFAFKSLELC